MPYKDSTPQLHVGNSSFEDWYQSHSKAAVGDKQLARDSYAAGMGDPLVKAAEPEWCPQCDGSGEGILNEGQGDDVREVVGLCPHCGGDGTLLAAYNTMAKNLKAECAKYLALCGKVYLAKANRDREADRRRFPDPAFNRWLDESITENGEFSVWHQINDIAGAHAAWTVKDFYDRKPESHSEL